MDVKLNCTRTIRSDACEVTISASIEVATDGFNNPPKDLASLFERIDEQLRRASGEEVSTWKGSTNGL